MLFHFSHLLSSHKIDFHPLLTETAFIKVINNLHIFESQRAMLSCLLELTHQLTQFIALCCLDHSLPLAPGTLSLASPLLSTTYWPSLAFLLDLSCSSLYKLKCLRFSLPCIFFKHTRTLISFSHMSANFINTLTRSSFLSPAFTCLLSSRFIYTTA